MTFLTRNFEILFRIRIIFLSLTKIFNGFLMFEDRKSFLPYIYLYLQQNKAAKLFTLIWKFDQFAERYRFYRYILYNLRDYPKFIYQFSTNKIQYYRHQFSSYTTILKPKLYSNWANTNFEIIIIRIRYAPCEEAPHLHIRWRHIKRIYYESA